MSPPQIVTPSSAASASAPPMSSSTSRSPRCSRQAEHEVCLARARSHRGEVRERGGEALVAEVGERRRREAKVDPLDERVDRRDDDAVRAHDRRVVAGARITRDPCSLGRARRSRRGSGRSARIRKVAGDRQSRSGLVAIKAAPRSRACRRRARSRRRAAGGSPRARQAGCSQIAYQGTSHADASRRARSLHPAAAIQSRSRAVESRSVRRSRITSVSPNATAKAAASEVDERVRRAAGDAAERVRGPLGQAPTAGALLVLPEQADRLERRRPEGGDAGTARSTVPRRARRRSVCSLRLLPRTRKGSTSPRRGLQPGAGGGERSRPARSRARARRRQALRARAEQRQHPGEPQQHDERVVVRAADDVDQHQRVQADRERGEHGVAPEPPRAAPGERDDAEAGERGDDLQVQKATGTPSFASGRSRS